MSENCIWGVVYKKRKKKQMIIECIEFWHMIWYYWVFIFLRMVKVFQKKMNERIP